MIIWMNVLGGVFAGDEVLLDVSFDAARAGWRIWLMAVRW